MQQGRNRLLAMCVLGALSSIGTSARAAGESATAQPSDNETLSEIVITARKRSERLIDVPISVSAMDSEALESQGIHSLGDLARATGDRARSSCETGAQPG